MERSRPATPAKREEARERGQVPRSRDLTVALSLLGGFISLHFVGKGLLDGACAMVKGLFSSLAAEPAGLSPERVRELLAFSSGSLILSFLPVAVLASGMTAAAAFLQGGLAFRPSTLALDFSRLSPLGGIRRLWNVRSLARGFFTVAKTTVVAWIAWKSVSGALSESLSAWSASPGSAGGGAQAVWARFAGELPRLGIEASLALVALGGVEYLFQRWQHERDLRMSPAEVREEILRLEGNVELKSKRRKTGQEGRGRIRLNGSRRELPSAEEESFLP